MLPKTLWAEAAKGQQERMVIDPWQERLSEELHHRDGFVPSNEIYGILGVATEKRNTGISQRIAAILTGMGWERTRRRDDDGRREWGYEPKAQELHP